MSRRVRWSATTHHPPQLAGPAGPAVVLTVCEQPPRNHPDAAALAGHVGQVNPLVSALERPSRTGPDVERTSFNPRVRGSIPRRPTPDQQFCLVIMRCTRGVATGGLHRRAGRSDLSRTARHGRVPLGSSRYCPARVCEPGRMQNPRLHTRRRRLSTAASVPGGPHRCGGGGLTRAAPRDLQDCGAVRAAVAGRRFRPVSRPASGSSNGDEFSAGETTGRVIMVVDGPMSAPAGRQGA